MLRCPGPYLLRLCFERLDFCLCLALCCFSSFFCFLQLCLYPRIQLVDFLLEFRFPISLCLGVLCLQLGNVGLHGGDVLIMNCFLYFTKGTTEDSTTNCFHSSVYWSRPLLVNLGDQ